MAQDLSSRRALIVDDEFLIAFDLEPSMRELGFDVCNLASNEKDVVALQACRSVPPSYRIGLAPFHVSRASELVANCESA